MKISWSFCLVVLAVMSMILLSYLHHPDRQPVLRGYKVSLPAFLQRDAEDASSEAELHGRTPADPDSERPTLNLALPDLEWDANEWHDNAPAYPDFFRGSKTVESRMNLSGRLLWDESEKAETLPIEDTILGAEVEVQLRLP